MVDMESVRVALRIRPLVPSERKRGYQVVVKKLDGANQVLVNNRDVFSFNCVFDWRDTQEQVYNLSMPNMLDKLFCGFNATILAYGQNGSGKTHTMGTAFNGSLDKNVGVIPRAIHDIFQRVNKLSHEYDFVIKCSFMELYQEQLFDLLSDKPRGKSIVDIREDRNGIIMVGLIEKEVHTAMEATDCLMKGSTFRAVGSTTLNRESSRSHAIFTVTLQTTKKDESRAVTTSKFYFVDLAGSERPQKIGVKSDRFNEGIKINQGLLALGNVISALGNGNSCVHYRDSKLTRLLQNSLGGNSVTLMIACVSSADYNVADTLNTLRYAERVRRIKNKPIVNQDSHVTEINRLNSIIQKLQMELLIKESKTTTIPSNSLKNIGPVKPLLNMSTTMPSEEQSRIYEELREKYQNLKEQWQTTVCEIREHERRERVLEAAHKNLKQKTGEMRNFFNELTKIGITSFIERKLVNAFMCVNKFVEDLYGELCQAETELMNHKQLSLLGPPVSAAKYIKTDKNNINISDKNCLIRERRTTVNINKLSTLDEDIKKKLKNSEKQIHKLTTKKCDFFCQSHHVKESVSAKLAEERRKRIQALEHEISIMKDKNTQQAKLLKIHEKDTQKIKNLISEIQAVEKCKVKLIRFMHSELEKFKQFKMIREKELMKYKDKNRKMQDEISSKEAMYNKERKVYKKVYEETIVINEKIQKALKMLKVALTQKQNKQSVKNSAVASVEIDKIIYHIKYEIEQWTRTAATTTTSTFRSSTSDQFAKKLII